MASLETASNGSTCGDYIDQSPINYQRVLAKSVSNRLLRAYGKDNGYRFIKDIVPATNYQQSIKLVEKIKETIQTNRHQQTWGVVYHPETEQEGHIHLFHRCLYYGSYCRCSALRGLRLKRRKSRYTPLLDTTFDFKFWINWFNYFLKEPRQVLYLEIAGVDYSHKVHRLKGLQQSSGLGEQETDGLLEGSWPSCQSSDWNSDIEPREDHSDQQTSRKVNYIVNRRGPVNGRLQSIVPRMKTKRTNQQHILDALEKLLVIPIESSCETEEWLKYPELLFLNKADLDYKRACSAYLRKTQFLNFNQLYDIHSNPETVGIYFQRSNKHYFNLEESYQHVYTLLLHQYNTPEGVCKFVKRLFDICEKNIPKRNCMQVVGPPNAGKTWFFDMLTAFYLNIGHVGNFDKNTSFPLNDCVSRRILIWNEPSIAPSQYDTLKMLAGGDPCPAKIKYEGDGKITRTPLIVTSNKNVFPNTEVWNSRVYKEEWKSSSCLKDLHYYPHPLTYYVLVTKLL